MKDFLEDGAYHPRPTKCLLGSKGYVSEVDPGDIFPD